MRWRTLVAGLTVGGALLTAGCATFTDQPKDWHPQDELTPQAAPDPQLPGDEGGLRRVRRRRTQPKPSDVPPPDGCKDYNPAVIGTCMATVVAVAALPGDGQDPAALVGERDTGRILRVKHGAKPQVVATLPVDASSRRRADRAGAVPQLRRGPAALRLHHDDDRQPAGAHRAR